MGLLGDLSAWIDNKKRIAGQAVSGGLLSNGLYNTNQDIRANLNAMGQAVQGSVMPQVNDQLVQEGMTAAQPAAGLLGATVWHGSPHVFDKFDASKIGTGEGAQAYGHGLYLAENPAVAKQYATDRSYVGKAMAGARDGADWDAARIAQDAINVHGQDAATHLQSVLRQNSSLKNKGQAAENQKVQDAIDLIRGGNVARKSALYKVDLPDEWLPKMLDWDKPLSQQPESVRKAIGDHMSLNGTKSYTTPEGERVFLDVGSESGLRGQDVYRKMGEASKSDAAETLRWLGIPGIKYLDGGSRSAGEGSRNYVVFPGMEHLLKILERQ